MNKQVFSKSELKRIIEANYDIGTIKDINSILEGASSECFHIVTENGDYLFKDIEMTLNLKWINLHIKILMEIILLAKFYAVRIPLTLSLILPLPVFTLLVGS